MNLPEIGSFWMIEINASWQLARVTKILRESIWYVYYNTSDNNKETETFMYKEAWQHYLKHGWAKYVMEFNKELDLL